jgi:hypothetical protein
MSTSEPQLSELQRRTLANLSVPRNPDDLALHVNPYAVATAEEIDSLLRGELSDNGWVVNVGQHTDPAKLAAFVQAHDTAMELPDEKAQNYAEFLAARPDLGWQLKGDLWMLTTEGLAQLHAPVPVNRPPLTPSEIQAVVDSEFKRVIKEPFVPGETSLAATLLDHEFTDWFEVIADDCEARWNVRPVSPIAGGSSGWTNAYRISILDQENQKTAVGAVVDPWYMALSILAFTAADTGTTADDGSHKPTYTGYARKSVAGTDMAGASGSGTSSNTSAIVFAACTNLTSTIVAFGNCVASTVGVLRKWGDCAQTVVSITQTPPQFAIGAYTTTAT